MMRMGADEAERGGSAMLAAAGFALVTGAIAIRTSDEELAECYRLMAEARDEITRLEAERRDHLWLLKGSRLTLDAIAVGREGPADAEAQAQRIVDHTGHGVTDEPPHTLVENDRLRDEITRLRELCGFLIDAAATHRIAVPLNSSLLDLAADIAGGALLDAPSTGEVEHG